ncbi:MAG TPA: ABC transporter ATP-binding protein [Frankiaceae bacterium]
MAADRVTAALTARLRTGAGDFALTADLTAAPGQTLGVVGPNGAGKTTLLRALAGLLPPGGPVTLGDAVLDDPAARLHVPPERRDIGVVFQDLLLFPRLSARENVAFGLRARGAGRREARATADAWLDRVDLAGLGDRRPGQLSGGQQQRVALARALAPGPRLLLLDEPLSSLDPTAAAAARALLTTHLSAFDGVTVLVTHDPLEALVLADRLVVLDAGRVAQEGPPADVAARPRTAHVAQLVGLTLLTATAHGVELAPDEGGRLIAAEPHEGRVLVAVRPGAVSVFLERPTGSPRNVWPATVSALEPAGGAVRVTLGGPPSLLADLTPAAVAELGLRPGRQVWAAVKAGDVVAYPA